MSACNDIRMNSKFYRETIHWRNNTKLLIKQNIRSLEMFACLSRLFWIFYAFNGMQNEDSRFVEWKNLKIVATVIMSLWYWLSVVENNEKKILENCQYKFVSKMTFAFVSECVCEKYYTNSRNVSIGNQITGYKNKQLSLERHSEKYFSYWQRIIGFDWSSWNVEHRCNILSKM